MQTFFVVATLHRFEELRRLVGYSRALRLLDELCEELATLLPPGTDLRPNRSSIEFTIELASLSAAQAWLGGLHRRIGGEVPTRKRRLPRRLAIVAVRCPHALFSDRAVQQAEEALHATHLIEPPIRLIELQEEECKEQRLMEDLRRALRADALHLHYQPKLCARGGSLAGAEALLRWTHETRGSVSPALFVPIAERSGDIRALTDWVLDRAVQDSAALTHAGLQVPVHVNISAQLVADRGFTEDALGQLARSPGEIGLEITETAMMTDPESALRNLHQLAEAGIHLAIDDYGASFSSLAYLQRLPVHELKIDQMFISRLTSGARDPLLVRSTIDLAHALEMQVTAEGVESPAALALLQVMRCDMVQGFLLSHPLPLPDLIDFARRARDASMLPAPSPPARWASLRGGAAA